MALWPATPFVAAMKPWMARPIITSATKPPPSESSAKPVTNADSPDIGSVTRPRASGDTRRIMNGARTKPAMLPTAYAATTMPAYFWSEPLWLSSTGM